METIEALRMRILTLQKELEDEKQAHHFTKIKLAKTTNRMMMPDLFGNTSAPPATIDKSTVTLVNLYNDGFSISEMANILLGNKTLKSRLHRMLVKARNTHPELFNKTK